MPRKRVRKLGSPTTYMAETWARERPDLRPSDYLFLMYAVRLGRIIDRLDDRFMRRNFGISSADMRVLFILRRTHTDSTPRPADLADAQIVTSGAMTKQLDRLEALNLVQRVRNGDGYVSVTITAEGVSLADLAITAMIETSPLSSRKLGFSEHDRDKLTRLCEKLLIELEDK